MGRACKDLELQVTDDLQRQMYSSYFSTEEYEEDAPLQHSVQGFFGAVIKVQTFGQSLFTQHRSASPIEDDIRE